MQRACVWPCTCRRCSLCSSKEKKKKENNYIKVLLLCCVRLSVCVCLCTPPTPTSLHPLPACLHTCHIFTRTGERAPVGGESVTDYCRHIALPANMACLNTLKQEIKTLEKIFPKNHERFQILNSSVDELLCRFIDKNGKRYDIHANITVSTQRKKHIL